MINNNEINFLVIEDNELDVEKLQRCFNQLRITNPLFVASDGVEGLEKLRSGEVPAPFIILLDLNMPRMNGLEFLAELRADPELADAVVYILTTSDHHRDIAGAHAHNVAGYIVKPLTREELSKSMEKMNAFWQICEYKSV